MFKINLLNVNRSRKKDQSDCGNYIGSRLAKSKIRILARKMEQRKVQEKNL